MAAQTKIERWSERILKHSNIYICSKSLHVCEMKFSKRSVFPSIWRGDEVIFRPQMKGPGKAGYEWGEKALHWLKRGSFGRSCEQRRRSLYFAMTQVHREDFLVRMVFCKHFPENTKSTVLCLEKSTQGIVTKVQRTVKWPEKMIDCFWWTWY